MCFDNLQIKHVTNNRGFFFNEELYSGLKLSYYVVRDFVNIYFNMPFSSLDFI